jgi:uncharacterized protein YjiS (DUF1127 family)
MPSLTHVLGRADFRAPRQSWRSLAARAVRRLLALDILSRERTRLAALDDRMLRDIGLDRADVARALAEPEAHLRLILLRRLD